LTTWRIARREGRLGEVADALDPDPSDRHDAQLDVLEMGSARRLHPLVRIGIVATLTLVVIAAIAHRRVPAHHAARSPAPPSAAERLSLGEDSRAAELGLVRSFAVVNRQSVAGPAARGGCLLIDTSRPSPELALCQAAVRVLPGFTFTDYSLTSDGSGRPWQLIGSGRDAGGTVVVVVIRRGITGVAHDGQPYLTTAAEGAPLVQAVARSPAPGWWVLVGSMGSAADLPDVGALARLAGDPTVLW
jgi:hypothetical protein